MKFEIYKDVDNEWRWRLKASNGRIIAVGEGYKRKSSVIKVINLINNCNVTRIDILD